MFYGSSALLNSGHYYNLLYQEGIRKDLLNVIGNQYDFNPVFVLALHEGEPIDRVNRDVDWNHSVSPEKTREIGDVYLLVFAAVALREYEQLDNDRRSAYSDEVRGFLDSLRQDGYTYQNGHIYDATGTAVVPVPLGDTVGVQQPATVSKESPQTPAPASGPEPAPVGVTESANEEIATTMEAPTKESWSRGDKIGCMGLGIQSQHCVLQLWYVRQHS